MSSPAVARPRDPQRGLRAIGAMILLCHAIVVGLAIPVTKAYHADLPAVAVAGLAAIAVLDLVVAGVLGRPGGVVVGTVLQLGTVAAGVLAGPLLFIAVVFLAVWGGWLWMRWSVRQAWQRAGGTQ